MDLENLDLDFEAGSTAGDGAGGDNGGAGGEGESRRPLRRRSFSGGVAAAGEPASSTAAVRQRRDGSSGRGTRSNRDPLSKPRRTVSRRVAATVRPGRGQQGPHRPQAPRTLPGVVRPNTSPAVGEVAQRPGSVPPRWTEYTDDIAYLPTVYVAAPSLTTADRLSRRRGDGPSQQSG